MIASGTGGAGFEWISPGATSRTPRATTILPVLQIFAITFPFFLLGLLLFNPAWVVISIWFLYRIVRGMVAMGKDQGLHA